MKKVWTLNNKMCRADVMERIGRQLLLTVSVLVFLQGAIQEIKLADSPHLAAVQCEDILPVTYHNHLLFPRFFVVFMRVRPSIHPSRNFARVI